MQESRPSGHTLRSPVLDLLLRLAPVDPRAELRVLELDTDPEHGASAAELAARAGGSVVSVSQSTRVTSAARAAHQQHNQLTFHSGRLTTGWPARAPYDLIFSWQVMHRIPHSWVVQCSAGGRVLSPIWLPHRSGHAQIACVCLTVNQHGPQWPPQAATIASGDRAETATWSARTVLPDSDQDGYSFTCECGHCAPAEVECDATVL